MELNQYFFIMYVLKYLEYIKEMLNSLQLNMNEV